MTGKTVNKKRQEKAVAKTFTLAEGGITITEAREIVASELGVVPNTLARWQAIQGLDTPNPRVSNLVKSNGIVNTHNIDSSDSTLGNGLLNVFNSLITKNGVFTNQDASAICKVANNMLNRAKFELSVHKHVEKMNKRDSNRTVKNLLI
tara:strand:- start:894 stop:1340 length:447 start_codon:yes stop_codon:yes gene_type:complete